MKLPEGHRVIHKDAIINGYKTTVFVILGPLDPNREDQDDFTKPEVTHRYLSLSGLKAAIENGSAWLQSPLDNG